MNKKRKRMQNIFACLKYRCNKSKSKDYKYYGGRGIKCHWNYFHQFYEDMRKTYRPGLTIDRINNNGDYCKDNCRWLNKKKQPKNRRPFAQWNISKKFGRPCKITV